MKKFLILGVAIFSALTLSACSTSNTQSTTEAGQSNNQVNNPQQATDNSQQAVSGVKQNVNVASATSDLVTKPVQIADGNNWQIYNNDNYGFTLTFPDTWKGYIAKNRMLNTGNSIDFGFPDQSSLFNVSAISKTRWEKIKSENGTKPTYLGENKTFVFAWLPAQYGANSNMDARMKEISGITKTFKLTK